MSNYKFLVPAEHTMQESEYLAVSTEQIEKIPLADVMDSYGQKTGSYNAGDYVTLLTPNAVNVANESYYEDDEDLEEATENNSLKYEIGSDVLAYEEYSVFNAVIKQCEEDTDYELNQVIVEAIEYWDGHNLKTIILTDDYGVVPAYNIIDDEELETELNNAIEEMEYVGERLGIKIYETENYRIISSAWQGDFEAFSIQTK